MITLEHCIKVIEFCSKLFDFIISCASIFTNIVLNKNRNMRLYRIKIDCCHVSFLNSSSIKLPEVVKIYHNFFVIRKSVIQNLMLTLNAFTFALSY